MASAAFQTQRVQVRRIGVSSSPSSRSCVDADELAEAVDDEERRRDAVAIEVAAVRQDGGHPGADRVAPDDGGLADQDPRHVGDGVERPGGEHAGRDAQGAGARTVLSRHGVGRQQDQRAGRAGRRIESRGEGDASWSPGRRQWSVGERSGNRFPGQRVAIRSTVLRAAAVPRPRPSRTARPNSDTTERCTAACSAVYARRVGRPGGGAGISSASRCTRSRSRWRSCSTPSASCRAARRLTALRAAAEPGAQRLEEVAEVLHGEPRLVRFQRLVRRAHRLERAAHLDGPRPEQPAEGDGHRRVAPVGVERHAHLVLPQLPVELASGAGQFLRHQRQRPLQWRRPPPPRAAPRAPPAARDARRPEPDGRLGEPDVAAPRGPVPRRCGGKSGAAA